VAARLATTSWRSRQAARAARTAVFAGLASRFPNTVAQVAPTVRTSLCGVGDRVKPRGRRDRVRWLA
jgi:hypothetical protein